MVVNFSAVQGTLRVPPSKSHTQRALAASMLHHGTTDILFPGSSEDERAVYEIVSKRCLVNKITDGWRVVSSGVPSFSGTFFCGESGLAARLLSPLASLSGEPVIVDGKGSLLARPMHFFESVLPQLGVQVEGNGFLPLRVRGPLMPRDITVDGSISSQFISGLMFAFAFAARDNVCISVKGAVSNPYLQLSASVLNHFGRYVHQRADDAFEFDPSKNEDIRHVKASIEADWSSAAFWVCAAALRGTIMLEGLSQNSLQADKHILEALQQSGTPFSFSGSGLCVSEGSRNCFSIDLTDAPDLFPVLAVFAAGCTGTSFLSGVHRLRHKESDRAAQIMRLLKAMEVPFREEEGTLVIEGGHPAPLLRFDPPADHRMVMATALAGLYTGTCLFLESNSESVSKSYPEFWEHFRTHTIQ